MTRLSLSSYFDCTRLRSALATIAVSALLLNAITPAQAGLFDDDEARRAVLDLRTRTDNLADQLSAAQRTILNQANQLEQLQQQVATLRGQNEMLANQLVDMQKAKKEFYTDLDGRLKRVEPQQQQQSPQQPASSALDPAQLEANAFKAALAQFQKGDFARAANAFKGFLWKYPKSAYQPTARYWLGNAFYALRDYKRSTEMLQSVVKEYPSHERASEALFSIAQNQFEQGQKNMARQTLRQVIAQYGASDAAKNARTKLAQIH
ncbi:tol-pal system protein YbgF [Mycoavidus sp. B2-EB]|uniref:tol-pal system protein YbgF n=1 Tax=Mycoavidus sp. B2-EB TaxID=2651972 RepID=UPI00162A48B3|nr:tol-pal system protein YbgF [Mycoavidus sp. B2-EB]BBO60107.1 tol-pal system protein YbgF [Mycoavidus sp. B2-EB]